jgi:type IV pilus assembly protein PilE
MGEKTMTPTNRLQRGFTLIEVMIVVVIVAILAGIAIPAYGEYMKRSRRADARIALMEAAQQMERFFTAGATYVGATLGGTGGVYPATSPGGLYSLTFQADPTRNAYVLVAKPAAGSSQAGDTKCTQFTIDAKGNKAASQDTAECWDR